MIDDLTPYQIETYLKRIETYGEDGLKGIELFQAGQLLESINKEMDDIVSKINGIILSNPNYEYPPEYPEDSRAKYWAESYGCENKRKIRNIIKKFLRNHSLKKEATDVTSKVDNKDLEIQESLSHLVTHENSIEIVEAIKVQYKNIKGKRLKLLLLALQELDLLPKERIANKFHRCCEKEFMWDVASYNAMNGYDYNESLDKIELNKMKCFLTGLINNE